MGGLVPSLFGRHVGCLPAGARGFAAGELHYPVVSVPVGRADELACPDDHVAYLREKLDASQPLHLLLVGYSGNDREVLALVRDSGRGVKTLTVVDHTKDSADDVVQRLASEHGIPADSITSFDGDFDSWVASGGLARSCRT